MKEVMLDQMNAEVEQNVQTDKTVIIVAMIINVILLGLIPVWGPQRTTLRQGWL